MGSVSSQHDLNDAWYKAIEAGKAISIYAFYNPCVHDDDEDDLVQHITDNLKRKTEELVHVFGVGIPRNISIGFVPDEMRCRVTFSSINFEFDDFSYVLRRFHDALTIHPFVKGNMTVGIHPIGFDILARAPDRTKFDELAFHRVYH